MSLRDVVILEDDEAQAVYNFLPHPRLSQKSCTESKLPHTHLMAYDLPFIYVQRKFESRMFRLSTLCSPLLLFFRNFPLVCIPKSGPVFELVPASDMELRHGQESQA